MNLKATLFMLSAFNVVVGAVFWLIPGETAKYLGITTEASPPGYLFSIAGAAFIASAVLFSFTAYAPLANLNGVRFAILWNALMLIAAISSVAQGYVDWGHIWFIVALNAIFFLALAIFYPWKPRSA